MSSGFRLRVRFGKTGRLRFLSHLEVARALERTVRRAGLPYAVSQGFNPHMKIAFGPALPVGTAGLAEVFDVHLAEFVPTVEALDALRAAAPADLAPSAARYVPERRASLSAAVMGARYAIRLEGAAGRAADLADALAEVARRDAVTVEHKGRSRTFDPGRELLEAPSVAADGDDAVVHLATRIGQQGSLRPDAIVREALEYSGNGGDPQVVTRVCLLEEREGAPSDPLDLGV